MFTASKRNIIFYLRAAWPLYTFRRVLWVSCLVITHISRQWRRDFAVVARTAKKKKNYIQNVYEFIYGSRNWDANEVVSRARGDTFMGCPAHRLVFILFFFFGGHAATIAQSSPFWRAREKKTRLGIRSYMKSRYSPSRRPRRALFRGHWLWCQKNKCAERSPPQQQPQKSLYGSLSRSRSCGCCSRQMKWPNIAVRRARSIQSAPRRRREFSEVCLRVYRVSQNVYRR